MATFHFSKEFIEKCKEFIRNNPRVADDYQELVVRSGRMVLHILKEKFPDCDYGDYEDLAYKPYLRRRKNNGDKNPEETVPVRIPDGDVKQVRQLIRKLGLGRTVINFYYFATWIVLLGIWKLPEKPPY